MWCFYTKCSEILVEDIFVSTKSNNERIEGFFLRRFGMYAWEMLYAFQRVCFHLSTFNPGIILVIFEITIPVWKLWPIDADIIQPEEEKDRSYVIFLYVTRFAFFCRLFSLKIKWKSGIDNQLIGIHW